MGRAHQMLWEALVWTVAFGGLALMGVTVERRAAAGAALVNAQSALIAELVAEMARRREE